MNGNNKEEINALAATGAGTTVDGMGSTALGGGVAVPHLGVGIAAGAVGGFSGYDCTVCSKRHKVFRPSQSGVSS